MNEVNGDPKTLTMGGRQANDDVEKFNQKSCYQIQKIEILKEATIFTLWNMEPRVQSNHIFGCFLLLSLRKSKEKS